MRSHSRFAVLATAASLVVAGLAGCAKDDAPARTNAILTDREAARLAEIHLDDTAPDSNPRDVVSIIKTHDGRGYLVGFHSFFDETQHPAKMSRLVMVDHDGDAHELTFKD